MNLAKSLIVSGKNYCNHRAPMQWNGSFWPKIGPIFALRLQRTIQYSRIKACFAILNKGSNWRPFRVSEWIVLLIICWNFEYVNSLSLRDTHRLKKQNNETARTYRGNKRNIAFFSFCWVHPGSLIGLIQEEEWSKLQTKYGIKLPTSIKIIELNQLKMWAIFRYINSLTRRDTWYRYFRKNISKIPGDNGSSLNITITLKINVLANITITKTSVLVV
jgi:hypothetical protein